MVTLSGGDVLGAFSWLLVSGAVLIITILVIRNRARSAQPGGVAEDVHRSSEGASAHPSPEADVPEVPQPPQQQGGWQRFKEGWQGTGQEGTRFSDPAPPSRSPSGYQQRGPGVWSGVKIGCGIFIVLPIILFLLGIVLFALLAALGSA